MSESQQQQRVYIAAAARTPIGNFNGSLSQLKASELGSIVIKEVLKRAGIEADAVNEVIMGQALQAGQGQNPARQAALQAELPIEVPAYTVNMLCGSGLKSIALGFQSIRCGDSNIVICGGQENMSLSPHVLHLRNGTKMGTASMADSMLLDGLTDAIHNIHMGITAENLAKAHNISRQEQDAYAVHSQQLAAQAQQQNYFKAEIVPVNIVQRKGITQFDRDEYIKADSQLETLQKLRACFDASGSITAGNASGLNDAAAAVLLISEAELHRRALKPLGRIVAWSQSGVDPTIMGIAPVSAVQMVLSKAGWQANDVDLFELNEAFAAQALAVLKQLQLPAQKVNINGGAIALGHPIGASGTRVLVTLLYALQRTGGTKGVASLCIGGGMGIAIAVETV